ncbi:MAG TPA: pantetheine-phosphate adenylyltransferase [Candidatus Hydrogenedentes bacterium]|nr:pantetheine-phosphate adenylyltransferase [Candidatus Hydrogenedentota bacterium]HNT87186.1 pantetheine-phosphate adenylyltransferase [Candidatus Hydrogenedentota bacterium]
MSKRIALYPGSFDPPTRGHLDLIERAGRMFDQVIVAVAANIRKAGLFTVEERLEMLRDMVRDMPDVTVTQFDTLSVEFARKHGAIAIIRGLRVMSDFEYELTLAINNRKLNPEVDTVCLMPSEPYVFLSSSMVKEIASFGGDLGCSVAPEVEARLREKLRQARLE